MKIDYYYDAQVERILKHMIRLFGNFSILDGYNANGEPTYRRVPCRNGDISRQAAVVLHGNSENKLPSAPFITVTISNMELARDQVRAPMSNQTVVGVNKKDPVTGQYANQLEGYYEIERYNPVPWNFEFDVDIWTTNQQNKFELFEQIATLFSPAVPLQLGNNPLDPTSFSYVELTSYNHTSRSFPQGTDYNLDISQFKFKTMVFLSLPQKVNRAQLIQQIVTDFNIPAMNDLMLPTLTNWNTIATDVYAPGNHTVQISKASGTNDYRVKLCTKYGVDNVNGRVLSWDKLLTYYSPNYADQYIQLRLVDLLENDSTQIIGALTFMDTPNEMLFTVDPNTLDAPTAEPVLRFIDPMKEIFANLPAGRYIIHETAEERTIGSWIGNDNQEMLLHGCIINITQQRDIEVITPIDGTVLNNIEDGTRYKYLKQVGWHEVIKTTYGTGFWRLSFLDV